MTVAVIGANGQLGTDVSRGFSRNGDDVYELSHSDIEICSLESVREVLRGAKPRIIVNTAAMHNVESCEKDPLKAYEVNALGPRNLAHVARQIDAVLIHVSTDYVFDGSKKEPYLEADLALPLNVYGNTKLAGGAFIRATADKEFILRPSALYGGDPSRAQGGRNFVELRFKLAWERDGLRAVDGEIGSLKSTSELGRQIVVLSQTDSFGLYDATAEGNCTWYEFARKIFDLADVKTNLVVAAPNEVPSKVPRPKYSVLENNALKAIGLNSFQTWEEGLRSYLASRYQTN